MANLLRMLHFAVFAFLLFSVAPDAIAGQQCPDNFVAFRGTDSALACTCTADATQQGGVWGMDVYTEDSSICQAAVHAGLIPADGGDITVMPSPGLKAYPGLTRNGVASGNNGRSEGSFSFVRMPVPPANQSSGQSSGQIQTSGQGSVQAQVPAPPPPPALPAAVGGPENTLAQCPDNFVAFRGTTDALSCFCPAENVEVGGVWGMDVYTEDSSVCQAAVHAGYLTKSGGNLTIVPQPGRAAYAGVTRNDISSGNNGASESSFGFAPATTTAVYVPVKPIVQPQPQTPLSQCPDNFIAYRGTTDALSCFCSPESVDIGGVWGMDVYTEDSGICQAAVHYGVLTRDGGNISVLPQPGRKTYAGVTRNGMSSGNNGMAEGSFSFSPTLLVPDAAAAPQPAAPVQQAIAESLMETGEVQLYIHFATDSDQLYEDSLPVLTELLAALRKNPEIALKLIGHTDNVGSPDYNLALSAKRAKAVRFWLIQQGVLPTRIQSEGRGLSEPLEDNGTEYGRASNRRVQAIRLP